MRIGGVAIPRGTDEEQDQFILPGSICEDREGKYHAFYHRFTTEIIQNRENHLSVLMHCGPVRI